MKLIELFARTRSICKACERVKSWGGATLQTFSTDIEMFDKIDYVVDILEFDYSVVPWVPDVIWASPPCETCSIASCGHHWKKVYGVFTPKTDAAKIGLKIYLKTIEIINHYRKLNPDLIYFIENPVGLLRKMPFMKDRTLLRNVIRNTVAYCQYGDDRKKPTDIWTNLETWHPKPICNNGDKCHISAPRGSRTGTQGCKSYTDKSLIPKLLCDEIIKSCLLSINPQGELV